MLSKKTVGRCLLGAALLLPTLANASTITGTLAIGSLNVVLISAPGGNGTIQFTPVGGDDFVVNASTGTFLAAVGLNGKVTSSITQSGNPINTTVVVDNWLTIDSPSTLSFQLQQVVGGIDGSAGCAAGGVGAVCTPPGSPFNLQNISGGSSTAAFQVIGAFTNDGGVTYTPYSGTFQTTFNGMTYEALLNQIAGIGGPATPVQTSWSATFTPDTPEPGTIGLMITGLGLLASSRFRRKAAK